MRKIESEFKRIISGISSVDFNFVNGEPEPAPKSGKSVPIILGVAWKVFKAAKKNTPNFYIVKTYDPTNEIVDKVFSDIKDAEKMKAARDSVFKLETVIIPAVSIES
jgi:hypothetical protein